MLPTHFTLSTPITAHPLLSQPERRQKDTWQKRTDCHATLIRAFVRPTAPGLLAPIDFAFLALARRSWRAAAVRHSATAVQSSLGRCRGRFWQVYHPPEKTPPLPSFAARPANRARCQIGTPQDAAAEVLGLGSLRPPSSQALRSFLGASWLGWQGYL